MSATLHKKSILKKTAQVASSTLLSRFFGIIREFLLGRYIGAGALSDMFLTAFAIPNTLRKMFAEGALSAAFTPKIVALIRKNKDEAHSLLSLSLVVFEGTLLVLCAFVMLKAGFVLRLMAPGFSEEQIIQTIPYLRILMPLIFFLSSSALFAGALQAVGHFFVPAFGSVLLNIVFIIGLLVCLLFSLPVEALCYFVLFGGFLQFAMHLMMYFHLDFAFGRINERAWHNLGSVLVKFASCFIGMSFVEVSLLVDRQFASYLPAGSISCIHYAHRFMGIPLGVFAVAFSTILLSHFSRISTYAPRRLSFYLLESTKIIAWVTLPVTLIMSFFSFNIFETLFLSKNFSFEQVLVARGALSAFLISLFFLSLNKILLNIFYALHVTWIPMIVAILATAANIGANWVFVSWWQATGIALATSLSAALQTVLYLLFLHKHFNFKFYWHNGLLFFSRYAFQLLCIGTPFYYLYYGCQNAIVHYMGTWSYFFLHSIGLWVWVTPGIAAFFAMLFFTRKRFGIKVYFLD